MAERDEHISDELSRELDDRDMDVTQRNIEGSRRVIEERERRGKGLAPARNDPRHNDQSVAPGQTDLPMGGNSNPNSQGGSSKRHKPD